MLSDHGQYGNGALNAKASKQRIDYMRSFQTERGKAAIFKVKVAQAHYRN